LALAQTSAIVVGGFSHQGTLPTGGVLYLLFVCGDNSGNGGAGATGIIMMLTFMVLTCWSLW